ncbi:MAG: hypothetical protein HY912_22390 [Desulfomonile tiedjei]|uniref:Lipoprotein n=1 Tax=Desulfomonile tiedjei TaxID=2358 RepID=A0A9D6Z2I2_9BACT|nr:hypothetical protein [Desulfomonile tiedjei]
MKRRLGYKLLVIALCSWVAVTHMCAGTKSLECMLKTFTHSASCPCCAGFEPLAWPGMPDCEGFMDQEREGASEPMRTDSGAERCCKVCSSLPFVVVNYSFPFPMADSSAVAEMSLLVPDPGFTASLFKPPQS